MKTTITIREHADAALVAVGQFIDHEYMTQDEAADVVEDIVDRYVHIYAPADIQGAVADAARTKCAEMCD